MYQPCKIDFVMFIGVGHGTTSWPGVLTSLSFDVTVKWSVNQQRLLEVTASGQEIVWHITSCKTYKLSFLHLFNW